MNRHVWSTEKKPQEKSCRYDGNRVFFWVNSIWNPFANSEYWYMYEHTMCNQWFDQAYFCVAWSENESWGSSSLIAGTRFELKKIILLFRMVRQPSILELFWILIHIQVRIVLIHHNTLKIKQQHNEFTQDLSSQLQIESLQDQLWEKDSMLKEISGEINKRRDIKSNEDSNRREKCEYR